MYYILREDFGLRSYRLIPYAYIKRRFPIARNLKKVEFDRLLLADGSHLLPEDSLTTDLTKRSFIQPCEKDSVQLHSWQYYRHFDNQYFPAMNLQITSACNFNCKHCFNAADNICLSHTMTYETAVKLLDEAKDCGILTVTITGGEPLMHKDIRKIIEAIYQRDMFVNELNTNGYYLDQGFLDFLKSIGAHPILKISFDGLGFHDWMRNFIGAETAALQAIQRAAENGFTVVAQININRQNMSAIPETLNVLDSLGTHMAHIIRTSESPRWLKSGENLTLGIAEYFDVVLNIFKDYAQHPHSMKLRSWQFLALDVRRRVFMFEPVTAFSQQGARLTQPLCKGARGMIAVGADGTVYPCMQLSGTFEQLHMHLGKIKTNGLKPLLQDSRYLDCVCQTLEDRLKRNEKCRTCPYLSYCAGGCPALALLDPLEQSMLGLDRSKCVFFENRYDQKVQNALPDFQNLTPIENREEVLHG